MIFDQCRAALDPISTVIVSDSPDLPDRSAVDVTAKHTLHAEALRVMDDGFFEVTDEGDSVFHAPFCVRAERPISAPEMSADQVDRGIEREKKLVAEVPCECDPPRVLHHRVQLVAVKHKDTPAIGRYMDGVRLDRDVAVLSAKPERNSSWFPGM